MIKAPAESVSTLWFKGGAFLPCLHKAEEPGICQLKKMHSVRVVCQVLFGQNEDCILGESSEKLLQRGSGGRSISYKRFPASH